MVNMRARNSRLRRPPASRLKTRPAVHWRFLGLFFAVHTQLSPNHGYVGHTSGQVPIGVIVLFAIFGANRSASGRTSNARRALRVSGGGPRDTVGSGWG